MIIDHKQIQYKIECTKFKNLIEAALIQKKTVFHCFISSDWGLINEGFIILRGHVRILCPLSRHNWQVHVLLPVGEPLVAWVPLNFTPITWGQVLRLWPLWWHSLQRWFLLTVFPWLLGLDFRQVLLLWPSSPHNRHLNRLSIKLSLSSRQ